MAFDLSKPAEVEEAAIGDTVNVLLHRELIVEKHSEVADNTCRLHNDVVDTQRPISRRRLTQSSFGSKPDQFCLGCVELQPARRTPRLQVDIFSSLKHVSDCSSLSASDFCKI